MGAERDQRLPHQITLRSWVTNGGVEEEIQSRQPGRSAAAELLGRGPKGTRPFAPGTIVLSGTLNMREGVNQFADHWRAEMNDPVTGNTISIDYAADGQADQLTAR